MLETLSTALMGILVVFGGLYATLRWIVLAGQPIHRVESGRPRWVPSSEVVGNPSPPNP